MRQKFEAFQREQESFLSPSDTHYLRYNKYLTNPVFSVRTVSYGSSVGNLRYGPRTRLVRGIYDTFIVCFHLLPFACD